MKIFNYFVQMDITIYLFTFFFCIVGFAHECEVQESPFDLNYLVLKDSKSNP
jgi:hypothetical protein